MDEIIKKLLTGGVSHDIIEKLKIGLGNTFESELITNGLMEAAQKIGIDTADLPHIDFQQLRDMPQETVDEVISHEAIPSSQE